MIAAEVRMDWYGTLALIGTLAAAPAAMACGVDTDCTVATGTYRIDLPAGAAPGLGAVVFAHGYRGTAAGTMKNTSLRAMATGRGMALIALDAGGDDWNIPDAPQDSVGGRDEMAYLDAVVADAGRRFGIDPARVVVTGFSAGGMFVWNVICARGDAFAGYVPYSGTFWKGPPASCPAPAQNVIHVHGTSDTTVPMQGRAIADTRQGSVPEALAMYAAAMGFASGTGYGMADMTCSHAANAAGKRLDLCLFDGEHSFSAERLGAALDRLMSGR
jgi:polyhydroxybutyrate depolymerase